LGSKIAKFLAKRKIFYLILARRAGLYRPNKKLFCFCKTILGFILIKNTFLPLFIPKKVKGRGRVLYCVKILRKIKNIYIFLTITIDTFP